MKKIIGIDLFCGVGGLTYGLMQAGIKIKAGVDNDKSCEFAFKKNNNVDFILKDISELKGQELIEYFDSNSYKLIAGCAPCQPYSSHQKKKDNLYRAKHTKYGLINEFLRIVKETQPDFVTMENVPNLKNDPLFKDFIFWFTSNGYEIDYAIIDVSKIGVPQKRKRLVFVASKISKIKLFHNLENKCLISIKEAIGFLPPLKAGHSNNEDPLHTSSKLSKLNKMRIRASKQGGTWRDWPEYLLPDCYKKETGKSYSAVYGRVKENEPSPTLTTQFTKYGSGRYGHYEQDRGLSLREGAIIQSFPITYDFGISDGISKTDISRHIGNAVPPILGKFIGDVLIYG